MNNKLQARHYDNPVQRMYLGSEIDRMFDDMMGSIASPFGLLASLGPAHPLGRELEKGALRPKMSITGDETAWQVAVEVPGVDEQNLNVEMKDNSLIISGEKKREVEEKDEQGVYHMERSFGSFRRVVSVPEDVKSEEISASYKNGVLTVTLPREGKSSEEPRKIEITQG